MEQSLNLPQGARIAIDTYNNVRVLLEGEPLLPGEIAVSASELFDQFPELSVNISTLLDQTSQLPLK